MAPCAATTDDVATTWITAAELHYGAAKSVAPEKNRTLLKAFLGTGQRLADADLLIGAIAAANRAIVVTGNRRHYERIPGVTIEDWLRP